MTAPAAVDVNLDRRWLVDSLRIVEWLGSSDGGYYRAALLALLDAERPRRGVAYVGIEGVDVDALEEERSYAERYASTARWGPCARCLGGPVLTFVDGRKVWWPDLTIHECDSASAPSRRALPPRQLAGGRR